MRRPPSKRNAGNKPLRDHMERVHCKCYVLTVKCELPSNTELGERGRAEEAEGRRNAGKENEIAQM